MEDYSKGKIYKIISDHCELPYIGSTTDPLEIRFDEHQRWYKKWIDNGRKRSAGQYCSSAEILQYDDAIIELVKNYPCNSKKELRKYEGTFQQIGVNCVNIQKAGRTRAEYHQQVTKNRPPEELERTKELVKIYNAKSTTKEKRGKKTKCKCGEEVILTTPTKRARHEGGILHKLFLKDPKAHAIELKEKIERDKVPKFECPCGSKINISQTTGSINAHKKKPKHQNWLKTQQ